MKLFEPPSDCLRVAEGELNVVLNKKFNSGNEARELASSDAACFMFTNRQQKSLRARTWNLAWSGKVEIV